MKKKYEVKLGRPTDDPKIHRIGVRLNEEDFEKLENYCKEKNLSKTEAISNAIKKL